MIKKTTEAWELSRNLAAEGGHSRYAGTRYHFLDTYKTMMERGIKARVYPATVDGSASGEPVLMTRATLAKKRIEMAGTFNSQMLQNPSPNEDAYFKKEWFRWYETAPKHLAKYGASDFAVTAKGGDFTVHLVAGVDPDDNIYILEVWRKQATTDVWIDQMIGLMQKHSPIYEWAAPADQIKRSIGPFLTKRMAEDLSEYYHDLGIKVRYLHSDIKTLERAEIIRDLRRGVFDVLVGINLLREGLDLPEVTLVAILDADKEGFLRSTTSLIQTIGRCARHIEGRAILYADRRTDSMNQAISETNRRRDKQVAYNTENNITPMSIIKSVDMELARIVEADYVTVPVDDASLDAAAANITNEAQLAEMLQQLETQMREAAKKFEFEKAAQLRDRIRSLKQKDLAGLFGTEREEVKES
jgi:hypothetical protein